MKVVCAWCNKTIKEGPDEPVSHGMCPACYTKFKDSGGNYHEGIRGGQGKAVSDAARPLVCKFCKRNAENDKRVVFLGFSPDEASEPEYVCLDCYRKRKRDDHEGIAGGQGRTGKEVAVRTDAATIALAVLVGIGIILAFIQAIF